MFVFFTLVVAVSIYTYYTTSVLHVLVSIYMLLLLYTYGYMSIRYTLYIYPAPSIRMTWTSSAASVKPVVVRKRATGFFLVRFLLSLSPFDRHAVGSFQEEEGRGAARRR